MRGRYSQSRLTQLEDQAIEFTDDDNLESSHETLCTRLADSLFGDLHCFRGVNSSSTLNRATVHHPLLGLFANVITNQGYHEQQEMDLSSIPTDSGVYCMYDLDNTPAYAGQTSNLRSRLRQHFVRQDSSVSSYGRLDPWDIAFVDWWVTEQTDQAEQDLLGELNPYLNFAAESETGLSQGRINLEAPDGSFTLMSEEEQAFRRQPYNRVKQKIEHINRMVDKIKYANHSDDTRRTLYQHKRILEENLEEFLGVDDLER